MITVDLLEKDYIAYKFLLEKYAEYKSTEEYREIYDEETEDHFGPAHHGLPGLEAALWDGPVRHQPASQFRLP